MGYQCIAGMGRCEDMEKARVEWIEEVAESLMLFP